MNHWRLAALLLACAGAAHAATPDSGTLTDNGETIEYTGGPFVGANVSGEGGDPVCQEPVLPCDNFDLTIDLPEGYVATYPSAIVRVVIDVTAPPPAGGDAVDYDLYLLDPDGNILSESTSPGALEVVSVLANDGVFDYVVRVVPYNTLGTTYTAVVELIPGDAVGEDGEKSSAGSRSSSSGSGSLGHGLLVLALAGLRRRRR